MQMAEIRLDGNAAGGVLRDVFARDMTAASATCAACGRSNPVGTLHEYGQSMGVILRCPACGSAMLRIVRAAGWLRVDASGLALLAIRESAGLG